MRRRGALLFAGGSMSWAVAQWLLIWMFARFAGGPEAVGLYVLVLSIATPVFTFAQLGLRTVYLSLTVNYPWRSYFLLRFGGLLVAILALALYFGASATVALGLWMAVLLTKVADLYFDLLQARIQRSNNLASLGLLNIANSLGTIALAAVALWVFGSVTAAIFASALMSTVVAAVGQRLAVRQQFEPAADASGYREILGAGVPTTLSETLAALATYLPVLVLSRIAEESRVGVFAAASYLLTFANLAGAIAKNLLITSFRQSLEGDGVKALSRRSHRLAFKIGLVGCAGTPLVILLGDPMLRLFYGDEFGMAYGELSLLAIATIPIAPSYIYSTTLNVLHRFSIQAWIWVTAVVLGLVVGVACIVLNAAPLSVALAVAIAASWGRLLGTFLFVMRSARR